MAAEDVAVNDLHAIVSADLADNLDEERDYAFMRP